MKKMLLAGDVGGTKTNLAIFSAENEPSAAVAERTFQSRNYSSLESLVKEFLDQTGIAVQYATFGIAGPMINGTVSTTNLPWVIDQKRLLTEFKFTSVHLLNDLEATAYSVPLLKAEDLHTINAGEVTPRGVMALIAPGTGLGEAFLTWDGVRYQAHPSEGGHADFAPTNPNEIDLLKYLLGRFGHVSYERVCSGQGIMNIYDYYCKGLTGDEETWFQHDTNQLVTSDDPVPIIAQAALRDDQTSSVCASTINTFITILAREAGNLALKFLATNGVFVGGGIPTHILPAIKNDQFMAAFTQKGRMSTLLSKIPVHVILNSRAALLGAAHFGFDSLFTRRVC
jgi:glucokinase